MIKVFLKGLIRFLGYDIVPRYTEGVHVRLLRQFRYIARSFERIEGINGSIVECGVGKGRTLLYFSYLVKQEGKNRQIYGFDSFEGFPEPSLEDKSSRMPKKGEWGGILPTQIVGLLHTAGFSETWIKDNVHLVKGFFNQTVQHYDGGPIALLHVDADLYESYIDSLTVLFPQVAEGGIVLFDEYEDENWPGATKAINEYFAKTPYKIEKDLEAGKAFLVKRRQ